MQNFIVEHTALFFAMVFGCGMGFGFVFAEALIWDSNRPPQWVRDLDKREAAERRAALARMATR